MNEQIKFDIIKSLVDHGCKNKLSASLKLGCTVRTINRMIAGYKKQGKSFFIHGNTGRIPVNKTSEVLKNKVIDLYKTKYYDANFTHYKELLEEYENINLSVSNITSILEEADIYSPKITRKKKKRIKIELKKKLDQTSSIKKQIEIKSNQVMLEDAHPRKPRSKYFGEMIQMDASSYYWFGNIKTNLHLAVDDASGCVVGAYFDTEETLDGYYHVFQQILLKYGIPYSFFTDNRTVFIYNSQNDKSIENNYHTQFAYACKQLGVEIRTSSVPQSKGRIERLNGSFQSRLPIELRLANIKTLDEANKFLKKYIVKYNKQFSLPIKKFSSVFVEAPSKEKLNYILAILSERKIDFGHSVKYKNKFYRLLDGGGNQVFFKNGTEVIIIQAFNKKLYASFGDKVYALEEIQNHQTYSKNFDNNYTKIQTKKIHIPPMDHPWRKDMFTMFIKSYTKNTNIIA